MKDTASWQGMIRARTAGRFAFMDEGAGEGGAGGDGGAGDGGAGDGGAGKAGDVKEFKAIGSQDELDRIVQNRIARERDKYKDYDVLKTKASQFDELEEKQKTELQKALDKAAKAEGTAAETSLTALRLEVAIEKGLTAVQAKRLVGKDKAELEADADELVKSFTPEGDGGAAPSGLPKERLRGGGNPTGEVDETDPRKLAEGIQLY
jgi:hypothetical protein